MNSFHGPLGRLLQLHVCSLTCLYVQVSQGIARRLACLSHQIVKALYKP